MTIEAPLRHEVAPGYCEESAPRDSPIGWIRISDDLERRIRHVRVVTGCTLDYGPADGLDARLHVVSVVQVQVVEIADWSGHPERGGTEELGGDVRARHSAVVTVEAELLLLMQRVVGGTGVDNCIPRAEDLPLVSRKKVVTRCPWS